MQYLVVVAFLFGVELPKPATFTTQSFHIAPGARIRAGAGRGRFSRWRYPRPQPFSGRHPSTVAPGSCWRLPRFQL